MRQIHHSDGKLLIDYSGPAIFVTALGHLQQYLNLRHAVTARTLAFIGSTPKFIVLENSRP